MWEEVGNEDVSVTKEKTCGSMTMYAAAIFVHQNKYIPAKKGEKRVTIEAVITNLNCKLQILFPLVPVYGQEVEFGLCPKLGWLGAFLVEDGRAEGGVED